MVLKHENSGTEYDNIRVVEYNFDLDEREIDSVSYLELPYFNKDKKLGESIVKKHYFNKSKSSFLEILPAYFEDENVYKNLNEFDEKIFYGLLRIYQLKRFDGKTIITDYFEILKNAKIAYNGATFQRVVDSIRRFTSIDIVFHNVKGSGDYSLKVIPNLRIIEKEELDTISEEERADYSRYFRNSKIKRILIIEINEIFLNEIKKINIESLFKLKNINARKILMLIEKMQRRDNKNVLSEKLEYISAFIPFNWEKTSIGRTIKYIEDALKELKQKKLLFDYEIVKVKPLSKSYLKIKVFNDGKPYFSDSMEGNLNELKEVIRRNIKFLKDFSMELKLISKSVKIDKSLLKHEIMRILFENMHTVKGIAGFLKMYSIYNILSEMEILVDQCIKEEIEFDLKKINVMLEGFHIIGRYIDDEIPLGKEESQKIIQNLRDI